MISATVLPCLALVVTDVEVHAEQDDGGWNKHGSCRPGTVVTVISLSPQKSSMRYLLTCRQQSRSREGSFP